MSPAQILAAGEISEWAFEHWMYALVILPTWGFLSLWGWVLVRRITRELSEIRRAMSQRHPGDDGATAEQVNQVAQQLFQLNQVLRDRATTPGSSLRKG